METKKAKLVEDEMCEINRNNSTTIDALPPEVLTHILKFLSPIERIHSEQVCKKWRNASRQTWRDIQELYILHPNKNDYHKFEDGAELYGFVEKELNQLFVGCDSPKIIRCLVSRAGCFIKKLIVDYGSSEYQEVIISVVSCYCQNLKVLFLENNDFELSVNEQLLLMLFECNQELHSIKCGYCVRNLIEVLPFRDWSSLRLRCSEICHERKIVALIEHSEALEEFECYRYTTRIVEALLKLPNLKSLYFSGIGFDETSLEMILHVPLLKRLRNLQLQQCLNDSDSHVLSNLLQHCCQLKRLSIYSYSIHGFPAMLLEAILALPNLETLELMSNVINDDVIIYFTKFRNLRLMDFEKSITNNGILQMIKKSEFLENLDIFFTGVTPEMFKQLVKEMNNRHRYLKVRVPWRIFDEESEISEGSKIRVMNYPLPCFNNYDL